MGHENDDNIATRLERIEAALDRVLSLLSGWPVAGRLASNLLTEAEAITYLRLDTIDISDPAATLRRYRESGLLRGTQVSKRVFYLKDELDGFLKRLTEQNPR
jgi:hypothetical protein